MTKEKTLYEKLTETYDLFVISDEGIEKIETDLKQTLKEVINKIEEIDCYAYARETAVNETKEIIKQKFGKELLK